MREESPIGADGKPGRAARAALPVELLVVVALVVGHRDRRGAARLVTRGVRTLVGELVDPAGAAVAVPLGSEEAENVRLADREAGHVVRREGLVRRHGDELEPGLA